MGLASKADRGKLEAMCRKDILQQRNEIKNLDRGELIIATNYMRFAAPVKVHKYEDYVAGRVGGLKADSAAVLAAADAVAPAQIL